MQKPSLFFILGVLLLLPSTISAQGLEELFLSLPDSAVLGLPKSDRQLLWKQAKSKVSVNDAMQHQDPKLQLAIHDLDIPNGYLGIAGYRFEGDFNLCYWNLPDGKKLIATYTESYAIFTAVEQFAFYRVLPHAPLTHVAPEELIPSFDSALYLGNPAQIRKTLQEIDVDLAILYVLPQRGRDIIVRVNADLPAAKMKRFFKGNRLQLIWNDGKFQIGKVYWESEPE